MLAIGSLVAVIATPSARYSVYVGDRSWLGVFGNPNLLGPVGTAAILCTIGVWPLVRRRTWPLLAAVAIVDVVVAVNATSVTAWLAFIVGCTAIGAIGLARRRRAVSPWTRRQALDRVAAVVAACVVAGAVSVAVGARCRQGRDV